MSEGKNNSGFVWGLLIGAAIGSLLSTEKGRRILKELSEHGIESVEKLMDIDEIREAMDEGVINRKENVEGEHSDPEKSSKREEVEVVVRKKPRLFRGIKK